jgi:hypothetical protein
MRRLGITGHSGGQSKSGKLSVFGHIYHKKYDRLMKALIIKVLKTDRPEG